MSDESGISLRADVLGRADVHIGMANGRTTEKPWTAQR
jgi:hypothetical protein